MEYPVLQMFFVVGLVLFICLIAHYLRNNTLALRYSLLWIAFAFSMLIISIFPAWLSRLMHFLGFELLSNAIFSLVIGFVATIALSLTSIVSRQSEKIKVLVQQVAILEKKVRELDDKNKKTKYENPCGSNIEHEIGEMRYFDGNSS